MYPFHDYERAIYAESIRYLRLLDENEIDQALQYFRHATIESEQASGYGPDAARSRLHPWVLAPETRTKHLLSTVNFSVTSDPSVMEMFSYVLLLGQRDHEIVPLLTAPYRDKFEIRDGRWTLTRRSIPTAGHRVDQGMAGSS